jgi:hypothetical protein
MAHLILGVEIWNYPLSSIQTMPNSLHWPMKNFSDLSSLTAMELQLERVDKSVIVRKSMGAHKVFPKLYWTMFPVLGHSRARAAALPLVWGLDLFCGAGGWLWELGSVKGNVSEIFLLWRSDTDSALDTQRESAYNIYIYKYIVCIPLNVCLYYVYSCI